jgi:hypothetical protein
VQAGRPIPPSLASERIARKSWSGSAGRGCCDRLDLREPRRAVHKSPGSPPLRGWEGVGGFTAAQGPRARRNKNHRAVTPACQFGQYGGRASNEGASAPVAISRRARRTAPVAARLLSVTSPRASARRMGRRRPDFGRTLRAPGRQGDAEPFPSLSEIATCGPAPDEKPGASLPCCEPGLDRHLGGFDPLCGSR